MAKLRPYKSADYENIGRALGLLKLARDLAKFVGAEKTVTKIRSAIRSAEGARRHVSRFLTP